jgi:hypothetical protein
MPCSFSVLTVAIAAAILPFTSLMPATEVRDTQCSTYPLRKETKDVISGDLAGQERRSSRPVHRIGQCWLRDARTVQCGGAPSCWKNTASYITVYRRIFQHIQVTVASAKTKVPIKPKYNRPHHTLTLGLSLMSSTVAWGVLIPRCILSVCLPSLKRVASSENVIFLRNLSSSSLQGLGNVP